MIGVVIDSNVIISALLFGGKPRQVVRLAEEGAYRAVFSGYLQSEVERTLAEKFQWPRSLVQKALTPLWQIAEMVRPVETITACDDADDNRILECAVAGRASYLITGDTALQRLDPFRDIRIVGPSGFLVAQPWIPHQNTGI